MLALIISGSSIEFSDIHPGANDGRKVLYQDLDVKAISVARVQSVLE